MDYEAFHRAVDELVRLNTTRRDALPPGIQVQMSTAQWLREFGTVHVNVGRRTGKTEYIRRRATEADLVVVFCEEMRRAAFRDVSAKVLTPGDLRRKKADSLHPRMVFVDEPGLVFRGIPEDQMYDDLARGPLQTFVLLGA